MAYFKSGGRGGFGNQSSGRSGGNRFGGRSSGGFGNRGGFGGRDSGRSDRPTEMHEAICSKCGKNCQVPFKPTGSKPVLCSDCFRQGGSGRDSSRGPRRDFGSRNQERSFSPQPGISPEQFNQMNIKLDKIIKILEELEMYEEESEEDSEEESKEETDKTSKE